MTAPVSVQATYPPDTGLRVGLVVARTGGGVDVEVSGKVINCGFLQGVGAVIGDPVAVLRGDASWLCLGRINSQPVNAVPLTQRTVQSGATNATGTYSNIDGITSFMKFGGPTESALDIGLTATFFSSSTASGADFALLINGIAYTIANLSPTLPAANAHLGMAGFASIPLLPAGTLVVQPQFRRLGGAGTITVNADDLLTFTIREVPTA